jgi:chlorophyllide a reductase subunit Z
MYGTFNMPSDLARDPPPGRRHRREVNMVMPLGSHLAEMRNLVNADVNICMYREFGRGLCEVLGKPYLQAPIGLQSTTKFLRKLGELTGPRPRALHRARKAHHDQAGLGSLALGHAGFLRHGLLRDRRERDLCPRRAQFPRRRSGPALRLRLGARRRRKTDNDEGARHGQRKAPLILMGSINERCTWPRWPRATGRAGLHSRLFPGAAIRRATGTPFMGYAGATYIVQEVCNGLFDALFHILPLAATWSSRCWCAFLRPSACATLPSGTRGQWKFNGFTGARRFGRCPPGQRSIGRNRHEHSHR